MQTDPALGSTLIGWTSYAASAPTKTAIRLRGALTLLSCRVQRKMDLRLEIKRLQNAAPKTSPWSLWRDVLPSTVHSLGAAKLSLLKHHLPQPAHRSNRATRPLPPSQSPQHLHKSATQALELCRWMNVGVTTQSCFPYQPRFDVVPLEMLRQSEILAACSSASPLRRRNTPYW